MTDRRKMKQAMTAKHVRDAQNLYGIAPSSGLREDSEDMMPAQPSIVMYTVQNMPRSNDSKSLTSIKKGYAPKPIPK
jgi:hypothetical protein